LKLIEKPDSGISNSSIPLFGTAGSALQSDSEEPQEKIEKKIDL
jgi:hypothetical protein